MTSVCVVSARRTTSTLAQQCAQDFEDAIIESTGARLLTPFLNENRSIGDADLVIFVALTFRDMEDLLIQTDLASGVHAVGYIFGAYPSAVGPRRNPVKRWRDNSRYRRYARLHRLYLGIGDGTEEISNRLGIATDYLPMAANVLGVGAQPFTPENDRPITISAFGRQHVPTMSALADHLNARDSEHLLYATNFVHTRGPADAVRYRSMFWQILRQSKISLAFDQISAPNPGGAQLSYVGPRWFESLAAGTVVLGWAPRSKDVGQLLDWTDSTIELADDPEASVTFVTNLLKDEERLQKASARNLSEMNRCHDWRHRLRWIMRDIGIAEPKQLGDQLEQLSAKAIALQPRPETKTLIAF